MSASIAAHVQPERAVATAFGPTGEILEESSGADLVEALAAISVPADRIAVADETRSLSAAAIGVVNLISAESAARALSLAGHHVVATLAVNTHPLPDDRIDALVRAAPKLVLLAGGTTGGDEAHVARLARELAIASDRLAAAGRAPTILYAGNPEARDAAIAALGDRLVEILPNVRPACEREDLDDAVARLAEAGSASDPEAPGTRFFTAGAARAAAVRALARGGDDGVLLLHQDARGHEAVSLLGEGWNRVEIREGSREGAIARHRAEARELCGVPLLREISDAFGGYTPGRDLLDAEPPGFILTSGPDTAGRDPAEVVALLIEAIRPRGVARIARVDGGRLTRLGLAWLAGFAPAESALLDLLSPLGAVASIDGPAAAIRIRGSEADGTVPAGGVARVPVTVPARLTLTARGGRIRPGRQRAVRLDLDPLPAGLLLDARGTPVCPPRRVRVLPSVGLRPLAGKRADRRRASPPGASR